MTNSAAALSKSLDEDVIHNGPKSSEIDCITGQYHCLLTQHSIYLQIAIYYCNILNTHDTNMSTYLDFLEALVFGNVSVLAYIHIMVCNALKVQLAVLYTGSLSLNQVYNIPVLSITEVNTNIY